MKVCDIIPSYFPAVVYGGWVFSTLDIHKQFASVGIEIFVSTTNDNGKTTIKAKADEFVKLQENIAVKYYPQTIREKFSFNMLFNLWKDIKPADVIRIHGIFSASTPIGLFSAFFLNKTNRVLLSPHGCMGNWCLKDGNKFKKPYLFFLIRPFANKVIWHATAEQEAEEIRANYPKANVKVISNGIYVNEYQNANKLSHAEFAKKYGNSTVVPEQILISMGRLHKKKGFDILIRAFKIIRQQLPKAVLFIAGEDFGEKDKLDKLIAELNLCDCIFFTGLISGQDKTDFYANADVFVLPSHNENFGMVYAESMACGTPVVASKDTPWKEIEELKIGRWVENTPAATAEAAIDILNRDYRKMGQEARKFIDQNYSWENIGKKFQSLFLEIKA